jgi:thioredoxin-dependent peroxiredoxin
MEQLRTLAVSASAAAVGVVTMLTGRAGDRPRLLKAGDLAPDFQLPGSDGRSYHLQEMLDAGCGVVVAWFPKAFTGGCRVECGSIKASGSDLRGFNMRYFGASVDHPDVNRRFALSLGLDYPILSDPTKQVARVYGVLAASGYAARRTFFIGSSGRILAVDTNVRCSSHGADITAQLTASGM